MSGWLLRELAEIGMRLARGVEREAQDGEGPGDAGRGDTGRGDAGLKFSRIARAVRQALMLEARLEAELAGVVRQRETALAARRVREAYAPISERSHLVRRAVARAIEADAQDDDQEEQLLESLDERLDSYEDDCDYLDRPVGELVALICQDLDVRADLSLWQDEPWAQAEAAAAAAANDPPAPDAAGAEPPPGSRSEPPPEPAPEWPPGRLAPPAALPSWFSG